MPITQEKEKMLSDLTQAEKAELLQWIMRDLGDAFPGIESRPVVIGRLPCISRIRMLVWVLKQSRRLGTSEAELLRDYPSLTAQYLANVRASENMAMPN